MQKKIFSRMCLLCCICIVVMYLASLPGAYGTGGIGWAYGLAAVVIITAVAVPVAWLLSKGVVSGLTRSGTDAGDYIELSPLFRQIEEQKSKIKSAATDLQELDISLRLIVDSMQEGMILLDSKGVIAMINDFALSALGVGGEELTGKHIFTAHHDPLFQAAVHAALGGKPGDELLEINGASLELAASPIFVDGVVRGAVLLLFDVTDRIAAEQMRREFTANVSHELKTPLTSISGYAEIMKDGIVKPDDMQRFAGNIYKEARRLIALVEDIMKLSHLDENSGELQKAEVALLPMAGTVAERLSDRAEHYGVSLSVSGKDAPVFGNAQLLDEMLYNLCDNAIKYNRPGGSVEIAVGKTPGGSAFITVSDTGIGIPKEYQSRIFERFYRVDKSHSKETGGTGLGLSIVKHGAAFHRAEISLNSTLGEGTEITLTFPQYISDERNHSI